jgi:hypothetical protein
MELVETLNRTVKLAMDEGRVASYDEAQALFASFRLRLSICPGFTKSAGAEAAVLTLLKAAPKTFLGGVQVSGALNERCTLAWYHGMTLAEVCACLGVHATSASVDPDVPTLVVGGGHPTQGVFSVGLSVTDDGFRLSPDTEANAAAGAPVEAGVAGAGAALNEAFQHAYNGNPVAGQREVRFRMPCRGREAEAGSMRVVGLGHLGQAFLWTTALARTRPCGWKIKLTDFDSVSLSSLSTCLLVEATDVGRAKVEAVGDKLRSVGIEVVLDPTRLDITQSAVHASEKLVIIAVDNLALRRGLDRLLGARVLEAGIGEGSDAFTRVQLHEFPGQRKARDVWAGDDPRSSRHVDISRPAYQALLDHTGDECGTALVAGRSVATPFVGALAGAVLAWVGGGAALADSALNYDVNAL